MAEEKPDEYYWKPGVGVYVEGRRHPTKEGWFAANGVIKFVYDEMGCTKEEFEQESEGEPFEPHEFLVVFDAGDSETYLCDEFTLCEIAGNKSWHKL